MTDREPFCSECGKGADYIIADATAQWDNDRQDWVLVGVQDACYCSCCDAGWSNHTVWRDVNYGSA